MTPGSLTSGETPNMIAISSQQEIAGSQSRSQSLLALNHDHNLVKAGRIQNLRHMAPHCLI